jgi:hypothetical protein
MEHEDIGDEDTPLLRPTMPNGVPDETWDGSTTGTHDLPDTGMPPDPELAESRLQRRVKEITRGVAETSKVVVETATVAVATSERVEDANTGITTLRMETRAKFDRVTDHLAAQDGTIREVAAVGLATQALALSTQGDVKGLTAHVDHIRKTTDDIVPKLLEQLTKDRDAARNDEYVVRTASVEIHKHAQMAEVEVEKHQELAAAEVEKNKELATIKEAADLAEHERTQAAARAEYDRKKTLKIIGIVGTIAAGIVAIIEIMLHG